MALSAWLLKVIDFQKNLCFGSKLGDRVVDFKKKADFLSVFSCMFCKLYSANSWLSLLGILQNKDQFSFPTKRIKPVKISYILQEQITDYDERKTNEKS